MKRYAILAVLCLFCSLLVASPVKKVSSDKSQTFMLETKIVGQLHIYGNRYILKENQGKNCFILLENKILEKMVADLRVMDVCAVEGEVYGFQKNRYLLLQRFEKLKSASPEIITFGIIDNNDESDKKVKKEKKSKKKSDKKVKKEKKSKKESDKKDQQDN